MTKLVRRVRPCSIQAVYKMLRALQRDGIIVKIGTLYSIQLPWAIELYQTSRRMIETIIGGDSVLFDFPQDQKRKTFTVNSVQESGLLGTHIISKLLERQKKGDYFEYTPFAFFLAANPNVERRFLKPVSILGGRYNLAIGSRTPLDLEFKREVDAAVPNALVRFVDGPECKYLALVGDVVVQAVFEPTWIKNLSMALSGKRSSPTLRAVNLADALIQQTRIKITLSVEKRKREEAKVFFEQWFDFDH